MYVCLHSKTPWIWAYSQKWTWTTPGSKLPDGAFFLSHVSQELKKSLDEFGQPWTLNPGDGAFYGPKVQPLIIMSCKHCNYCTFSNNSPLPWLFRAVTELNLARVTTVTAIEWHLKTEAWSLSHTVCEFKFACSLRWRFFRGLCFPGLPSKEAHPYHRKH